MLGAEHPVYEALGNRLPTIRDPYAWYLRVPDLSGFLNHIRPVLEKRLAEFDCIRTQPRDQDQFLSDWSANGHRKWKNHLH